MPSPLDTWFLAAFPRGASRLACALLCVVTLTACVRSRAVETDLEIVDVQTGWFDAGVVDGNMNKLVPSVSLRIRNISNEDISGVQMNAIFRRDGEQQVWGEHFIRAIGPDGLPAGQTGQAILLKSTLGYTGVQSRAQMLQNREFVDARVQIFGRHGSRNWVKMAEYPIDRRLVASTSVTPAQ